MVKPFVLLEGQDGAGKTTLAGELERLFGWPVVHTGPPTKAPLEHYLDMVRPFPKGGAVFDRMHPSSFVYGNVFRRIDDMELYEHWLLNAVLLGFGSFAVYCKPPQAAQAGNIASGPADEDAKVYEDPSRQEEVRKAYDYYFSRLCVLPYLEYDYTQPDGLERIAEGVSDVFSAAQEMPRPIGDQQCWGSPISPTWCLVGPVMDALRYLHRAMVAGGMDLINTCMVESLPDGWEASEAWEHTQIVALGPESHERLIAQKIGHRLAPAPAWVRDVHYKEMSRYGRALSGEEDWEPATNVIRFPTLARAGVVAVRR